VEWFVYSQPLWLISELRTLYCIQPNLITQSKRHMQQLLTLYACHSILGIVAEWIIVVPFDFGHYW